MTLRTAARRLEHDQLRSSPIREIMKLTDRKNILAMGLDPDEVISFAGGWVNHTAPDELRESYRAAAEDPGLFHELGAYSPTRGLPSLRRALIEYDRAVYGTEGLADEHLLVGEHRFTSEQLGRLVEYVDRGGMPRWEDERRERFFFLATNISLNSEYSSIE